MSTTSSETEPYATVRSPAPAGLLIVGWGNELRGDDAAGPRVIRALRRGAPHEATLVEAHQLDTIMAPQLASSLYAVFVDARLPDDSRDVLTTRMGAASGQHALGHTLGPEALCAVALELYGACPEAWLVTVPTEDLGFGAGISPRTAAGIRSAARRIRSLCDGLGFPWHRPCTN